MGEGCVTTTWLQFSQALHALTGKAKYVDEIEKSIFNHLFAAENPQTGRLSYYTALLGKKPYCCNIDGHCCLASIPRGFAIIPELIYTKNADNGLSVNSYPAKTVQGNVMTSDHKDVGFQLRVDSRFPEEGRAMVIQVSFDLYPQLLDGGQSYPGFVALKNGPQVLALDHALNPQIDDFTTVSLNSSTLTALPKTALPKGWLGSQVYSVEGLVGGKPATLKLVPFAEAGQTGSDLAVWLKKTCQ